jgi:hypothetical protein
MANLKLVAGMMPLNLLLKTQKVLLEIKFLERLAI